MFDIFFGLVVSGVLEVYVFDQIMVGWFERILCGVGYEVFGVCDFMIFFVGIGQVVMCYCIMFRYEGDWLDFFRFIIVKFLVYDQVSCKLGVKFGIYM